MDRQKSPVQFGRERGLVSGFYHLIAIVAEFSCSTENDIVMSNESLFGLDDLFSLAVAVYSLVSSGSNFFEGFQVDLPKPL